LNKQVVLRTGLTFDQSPTNNTDRSPRIPTGDRTIFSGAGYAVMDNLTVDVAYSYLKEESVKVNKSNALGSYSAKYENSANGFGLGVTYSLDPAWKAPLSAKEAGLFNGRRSGLEASAFSTARSNRIIRLGQAGETGDHLALTIHHIFVEIPLRRTALLRQHLEQVHASGPDRLRLGHGEGHTVIDITDLGRFLAGLGSA
jgi:hypothetical protein